MASTKPNAIFEYPGSDGAIVVAYRWDSVVPPRAAMQVNHGMGEHAQRYGEFARALNAVRIVVYAQDQRSHGATAKSTADLGQLGRQGWRMLLDDIHILTKLIGTQNRNMPLVLFGHSMGSFAVQQSLVGHSTDVNAVILSGTIALDLFAAAIDLEKPVDLTASNALFHPARTNFDWLSRDESIVDAYI
jgi:alpha-beta hydrolase superfamily lysophospholipase